MASSIQDGKIKVKIQEVQRTVPNVSRENVVLVLQYYDNDVNKTIDAFLTDGAKEALDQWQCLPNNKGSAAKKKKRKSQNKDKKQPLEDIIDGSCTDVSAQPAEAASRPPASSSTLSKEVPINLPNGYVKGAVSEGPVQNGISANDNCREVPVSRPHPTEEYKLHSKKELRSRTVSEASSASDRTGLAKSPHAGLEKSCKDLQRQTVSLQHNRVVLNDHIDRAFKRISEVFKELHSLLNNREAELIFELDKAKTQANEALAEQQSLAITLKFQTDRAQVMSEQDVALLRAKIKHFVSERKVYEDLSSAQRFTCEFAKLVDEIRKFGLVTPVNVASLEARRASFTSGTNSSTDPTSPTSPTLPTFNSAKSSTKASHTTLSNIASQQATPLPLPSEVGNSRVLSQSASLTRYETTEMKDRLSKLSISDTPQTPPSPVTGERGRGRGRGGNYRGRGSRNQYPAGNQSPRASGTEETSTGNRFVARGGRGRPGFSRGEGRGRPGGGFGAQTGSPETKPA